MSDARKVFLGVMDGYGKGKHIKSKNMQKINKNHAENQETKQKKNK